MNVQLAEPKDFKNIIGMLRFFVRIRNYGYIDRMGNALKYECVEMALKEALRSIKSIRDSASIDEKGSLYILDREKNKIYVPYLPSEDEINMFFVKTKEDIGLAHRVATYSLAFPEI
ncbi:MAG: type I-A CRISPR-associated protein Csa5, partial [Candidatus Methanosuratincola petrocarbonis]